MNMTDIRKYIAEFVGTGVLVLFGCGSAVAANAMFSMLGSVLPLAFTTLTISVAFGLCIVAMAYSIGNVSGCHINPAVSIGCFIARRMTVKDLIGYVIAQFLGGLAGAYLLSVIIKTRSSLGQNGYGDASALGIDAGTAVLVEIILTFVFVMVILCVTSKEEYSSIAGLVIGLTLTLIHIFGIPFTGTSVNPARSFGPAVLAGGDALKQLPVFIVAPVIGAAIAALFFSFVLQPKEALAEGPEEVSDDEAAEDAANDEEASDDEAAEDETKAAEDAAEETVETAEVQEGDALLNGSEDLNGGYYDPTEHYDPVEEMQIDKMPETEVETEAEAVEEADANADVSK